MKLTSKEQPLDFLRGREPETLYQELTAEIVVPERLPDLDRVVDAWGTVVLPERSVEAGSVRLSGGVQAGVVYVPEGEGAPQLLEGWLPFRLQRELQDRESCVITRLFLKSIDARSVNARKVLLRANLGIELTELTPEHLGLAAIEDAPEALQQQQNTYPALLPVDCAAQEFRVQDELQLTDTSPAIERILRWELNPKVHEGRVIGSRAVFKGEVDVALLYLGTDGSINTYRGRLPFSQYAELSGEWPDGQVEVWPVITAAQLETDGQMESRTLLADLNLLAQVCIIDRRPITVTEDAYALGGTLEPVWQTVSVQPRLDLQTIRQSARLQTPIKAERVLYVSLLADKPTQRRSQDSVYLTCALSGNLLYLGADGLLKSKSLRGECGCSTALAPSCRCLSRAALTAPPEASVNADGVQIDAELGFTLDIRQDGAWQNLAGGEITPREGKKRPSVVVRRYAGGPLWPLAKQLGASVSEIEAANSLTSQAAPENNILLIPLQ